MAPRYEGMSPSARFRDALEELGGLYAAFAQFLCWRADLLGTEYLGSVRQVRLRLLPIPRAEAVRTLSAELGANGELLARDLEADPCWNNLSRCAYRTRYRGRPVVVQLARDPVADLAFKDFERGLRLLKEEGTDRVTAPEVLSQFREWVRLADSQARERSYLEAVSGLRDKMIVDYPQLIPELTTGNILCWFWAEGEPVSSLVARGSGEAVQKLAEGVLEQLCILSVVDGEPDLDAIVLTKNGRLALRRANRLIAVPPALVGAALKYVSAVLAGDSPLAAHLLLKLAGASPADLESSLLDQLSSLQPELKVNVRFPQSATVFEGNWRALSRMGVEKPLFLDFMHRNMVAIGYWNAQTADPATPGTDCIAEAQWPVLGRLLRIRMEELLSRDKAFEWFVGSGLLFFDSLRQLSRLADGFRENDLFFGMATGGSQDASQKANRTLRSGIITVMLVIVFLICLRWGATVSTPFSTLLAALAIIAAVGVFWTVSRTG